MLREILDRCQIGDFPVSSSARQGEAFRPECTPYSFQAMSKNFLSIFEGDRIPLFLAPQAGVSESPFRRLCREFGADVVVSEFVSADGLSRGNQRTHSYLRFHKEERPIGIQIFGAEPAMMADAAAKVTEIYAPDFVDINFGCPVKKVVKRNGGSGCLRDLKMVGRITRAVVDATPIPVTVKTRSGFTEATRDPVAIGRAVQDAGAKMITLHPRTRTDMYSGSARWDEIAALVEALSIPVVGNGDIRKGEDARRMWDETGCHGIMMARGTHGAPWLFGQARAALEGRPVPETPDVKDRFEICLRHARNSIKFGGDLRGASVEFRKHLGWYTKGIRGGNRLREDLFQVTSIEEMEDILQDYLRKYLEESPEE
jgi:tRNA-dihydrouridine synthase B